MANLNPQDEERIVNAVLGRLAQAQLQAQPVVPAASAPVTQPARRPARRNVAPAPVAQPAPAPVARPAAQNAPPPPPANQGQAQGNAQANRNAQNAPANPPAERPGGSNHGCRNTIITVVVTGILVFLLFGCFLSWLLAGQVVLPTGPISFTQPAPVAVNPAPAQPAPLSTSIPMNAKRLEKGKATMPAWGYGPWGQSGFVYPKVAPGAAIPAGCSQPVTDFNGRNWVASGEWVYKLGSVSEVWVVVQGDAPGEVEWKGDQLILRSNATISGKAPASPDNTPRPSTGSSGISMVICTK